MKKSGKGVEEGRPSSISQVSKRREWSEAAQTRKHKAVPGKLPELEGPSQADMLDLQSASDTQCDLCQRTEENSDAVSMCLQGREGALCAVYHGDFSIRTESDTDICLLNRIITMPDGRIIIVDRHNGCKIKLFSEGYSLIDEMQCSSCTAVTCVDNNNITVVSLGYDIVTYSIINNKITETERKMHCGGLYDITYGQGDYILRYQTDGMDCLSHGTNVISQEKRTLILYDNIYYDSQSESLLVGYFAEKIIKCLALNGEIKWKVTIEDRPMGIIVVRDRILVGVDRGNTIREITLDGQLVPTPLLTSPDRVESLAYQRKQGRLLVGLTFSDTVKMFDLTG